MTQRSMFALVSLVLILSTQAYFANRSLAQASSSDQAFLGRWDLTLKTPQQEAPSWLEITQEGGQFHARLTSRWGHARPLPKVEISNGHILFVSPKEEEDRKDDMVFEGKLSGDKLVGTTTGPDGTPWSWTGERAPKLTRSGESKWGKPVQLFNGKDLTGWTMSDPNATAKWTVENGTLVSPGHGPELITTAKFNDFKLHVEFNCARGANSGVYLRGLYEVQILDLSPL
jgi:hypothetical protein